MILFQYHRSVAQFVWRRSCLFTVFLMFCFLFLQSVRHSPLATDRKFNEPEDMLCTMRTSQEQSISKLQNMSKIRSFGGHESSARKKAEQLGPELILITVANNMNGISSCCSGELGNPIQLSQRFASFGSGHGDSKCRSPHASFRDSGKRESAVREITIPVSDIMVVDMYGHGNSHRTNITTLSKGFFEFTLENRNGQEILLAFLRANLPEERVMEDIRLKRSSSGLSSRSFDVEAFTATRMAERIQHETLSEKLKRKVGRVVSSFEESK